MTRDELKHEIQLMCAGVTNLAELRSRLRIAYTPETVFHTNTPRQCTDCVLFLWEAFSIYDMRGDIELLGGATCALAHYAEVNPSSASELAALLATANNCLDFNQLTEV